MKRLFGMVSLACVILAGLALFAAPVMADMTDTQNPAFELPFDSGTDPGPANVIASVSNRSIQSETIVDELPDTPIFASVPTELVDLPSRSSQAVEQERMRGNSNLGRSNSQFARSLKPPIWRA